MNATKELELSAAERQIIQLIHSMERGELQISIRNNRPVRAEQILRCSVDDDCYEIGEKTDVWQSAAVH